ncbi:uncharacterized protein [Coffea arabica]|uniref:Reverse transcriptase zinc-binding domain-containing protein n=1 Tax=Coffea arabica TaxID=13443 RepID=A0A6P6X452_COFAR|nr:uncharacterized protein LOC113739213 [Coffea arabica]
MDVLEGIRRRIGNGRGTRIWEDKWIPNRPNGKLTTNKPHGCQLKQVSDLPTAGKQDSYYWIHAQKGEYTVQSGYKRWMKGKEQEGRNEGEQAGPSHERTSSIVWKALWNQKVKQKLKVFIWKCLHDALPVKELIFSRTNKGNPMCGGCGESVETLGHMLFQCKKAKEIWEMAQVQWDGLVHLTDNFPKWWYTVIEAQMIRGREEQINLTVNILWQIWKGRNEREFNQKDKEPHKIIEKASMEWMEFEEANKGRKERRSIQEIGVQQRTELNHVVGDMRILLKIHTQMDKDHHTVGIGIMATEHSGLLHVAWALRERMTGDPLQDQAEAVKLALMNAAKQGWSNIEVKLDSSKLKEFIVDSRHSSWRTATIREDIQSISSLFH